MTTAQRLLMATTLVLPLLLLGGQAAAIPPDVNGVPLDFLMNNVPLDFLTINSSSRRFFEAGNDRFEQEIERLIQGDFAFSEDLLMVGADVGLEDDWERLERLDEFLDDLDRRDLDLP